MVAIILPSDKPLTLGFGQKVKPCLFLKVVMLHIKLKGIEHHESKYAVITHTLDPMGWGQKVFFFSFLKVIMLHIKLKWKHCRPTCKVTF